MEQNTTRNREKKIVKCAAFIIYLTESGSKFLRIPTIVEAACSLPSSIHMYARNHNTNTDLFHRLYYLNDERATAPRFVKIGNFHPVFQKTIR